MTERRRQGVLVTGAGRGLGFETALTLAQAGFHVWAGLRDLGRSAVLEQAARQRGVKVTPVRLEVTDPECIDEAFRTVAGGPAPLYGLVNNAGITGRAYFEDYPEDRIRLTFEVNLFGAMNVTRRALPLLRQSGGRRIVMMSSVGGRIGSMSVAPYVASKFALEGFSESLALEVKPFGIEVVIIEPGIVNTDIWEEDSRILPAARYAQSPYRDLFWSAEAQARNLLQTSRLQPADVAARVLHAMTTRKPRLRYVVGKRASLVIALRRHLPGELFEKFYFGELLRRVTRNSKQTVVAGSAMEPQNTRR